MDNSKRFADDSPVRVVSIHILSFITILVFMSMGCRLTSSILSSENGSDAVAETTATAMPEGPIFRDDFNDQLDSAWAWQNEDVSRYKVNKGGWLEITGGNESILLGGKQTNLLWTPLPEGDYVISIHLKSQPLFDFQQAGILLYEDAEHFISLTRGYCRQCVLAAVVFSWNTASKEIG